MRAVAGLRPVFSACYFAITALFVVAAVALIVFGGIELWEGIDPWAGVPARDRLTAVLEGIGLLTVAVAALELAQTILEEEIERQAHMSSPTRARRFLSRFLVVVIVALSIEFLVVVFRLVHEDPSQLPATAWIGIAVAAMLAAWGVFVRLNRSAEELEPEAMEKVKQEDDEVG
jgi:hypothetical protein